MIFLKFFFIITKLIGVSVAWLAFLKSCLDNEYSGKILSHLKRTFYILSSMIGNTHECESVTGNN